MFVCLVCLFVPTQCLKKLYTIRIKISTSKDGKPGRFGMERTRTGGMKEGLKVWCIQFDSTRRILLLTSSNKRGCKESVLLVAVFLSLSLPPPLPAEQHLTANV